MHASHHNYDIMVDLLIRKYLLQCLTERYFDVAMKKLPKCDLPDEIRNISCKKCVVVGNGGVLRNSTLGKKIDGYDVIIRMNDGPVLGYEDDVGQKTTFRLCYPESIFSDSLHYDPNTTVVLMMFKPHDVKWLSELLLHRTVSTYGFWRKPAMKLIYQPHQMRVLNPYILKQVSQNLLNFPTSFPKTEGADGPNSAAIPTTIRIAAASLFGRWRAVTQTALQRPTIPKSPGNQGKHRVTKRRAALSNPMFTLVTIVKKKSKRYILTYRCLSSALCFSGLAVSTAAGKQSGDVTALLSGCPALTARPEKQSAEDRQR
ncbi:unnamed protein product [Ranitomeya imitator]|uniref:Uncharacterized protein n=1 Tax=Ranitomeya imitator TaxID=111125 RepID=A0ABN9LD25_9NEOB|nr:unnamed protein product [Ranitomeya imitator]